MRKIFKNFAKLLAFSTFALTAYTTAQALEVDVEYGVDYSVPKGESFEGTFMLLEPTTISVVTDLSGDMYKGTSIVDNDDVQFGVPSTYIYTNLPAGTYTYKVDAGFNFSGGSVKIVQGSAGGGDTGGGDTGGDGTVGVLPVPTTNFTLSQSLYTYTPTENGTLTIVYENQPFDNALYSEWVDGHGEGKVTLNEGIDPNTAKTFSWELEGNKTYYLDASYPANNVVTTSFKADGSTGGGDEEITDVPLTGGQYYIEDEFFGTFTTTDASTLTLTWIDWSGYMPADVVYKDKECTQLVEASVNDWNDNGQNYQEYNLSANTTYYVKVVVDSDGMGQAPYPFTLKFAFGEEEPGGGDEGPDGPTEPTDEWVPVEFDKVYSLQDGESVNLLISVKEDSVMTVTQTGASDSYLFTVPTDDLENYTDRVGADYTGSDPYTLTYDLKAGKNYYYFAKRDDAKYLELTSVKFELSNQQGGGGEPEQPGDLPEGYEALELNKVYSPNAVGAVKLAYTPTSSGVLTVTQTDSYDSHLFKAVPAYDESNGYENNLGIMLMPTNGYEDGVSVHPLKYGVAAGVTYYFVAKLSAGDAISSVEFTFEGASNDNTIQLDTPYVVNYQTPVYTFTPEETGILTVAWANPNPGGEPAMATSIVWGSSQGFLWSDFGCSTPMPMLDSEAIENVGWSVKFNVEAGKDYYLWLDDINNWQCTFSMEAGELQAASIKIIEPVPGTAYDTVNFQYYWNLILSPNEPSLEKVTLTYVPANDPNGNSTTIDLTEQTIDGGVFPPFEFGGDAMRISAVQLNNLLQNNEIANETDIVFTIYGLKAAGEYVTQNLMAQGDDYVNIEENGLVTVTFRCGTPIKLLTENWPNPFLSGWERGDKAGIATLVYDKEVYHVGAVSVTQGHQYYGSEGGGDTPPYSVTLPAQNVTWEGNTVTIDFTGINFNMPTGTSEVTIMVSGPTGQNGLNADYDGIPVLQHYATFTTDGAVVIPENIIYNIEPRDGVTFDGIFAEEAIEITLLDNVRESTASLTGVLSEENGEVLATFGFMKAVGDRWFYELEEGENYVFLKNHTYFLTVTAQNEAGETIGSQVVYWYGNSEESGVGTIGAANGENAIFTLTGVRVNTTDVNKLTNGLYIINGKKVIIRK